MMLPPGSDWSRDSHRWAGTVVRQTRASSHLGQHKPCKMHGQHGTHELQRVCACPPSSAHQRAALPCWHLLGENLRQDTVSSLHAGSRKSF